MRCGSSLNGKRGYALIECKDVIWNTRYMLTTVTLADCLNTIASQAQVRYSSLVFCVASQERAVSYCGCRGSEGLDARVDPALDDVLACKACDEVATAILPDLAFLK